MQLLFFKQKMENRSLKNRLYLNLVQKAPKPTFLLEKDQKSSEQPLRPKISHENSFPDNMISQPFFKQGKFSLSLKEKPGKKPPPKPKDVPIQKLSKQAKTMLEEGKGKIKHNLKPRDIFSFYDTFPEMLEDFFYLNRIEHPYDYEIVSYAKRNPYEYMTISSQGVTLYHQKQAEFLTRDEWLQDERIYHKLQKIDFFSQYKTSKNFGIWKNRMKRHYMKEMSNILDEKLFLAYNYPRKCLLDIKLASLRLKQSLNMMPNNMIEPIKWKQLIEVSEKYQHKDLLGKIGEIQTVIIESLQVAISEEINSFKIKNNIKIDGLNSKEGNKEGYVYSQEAILRKQYKRIVKLIKLGQSILLESKIELFQRFLEDIVEKLKEVSEEHLKEDWVIIIFTAFPSLASELSVDWNPATQDFISTFRKIISKAVFIVSEHHQKIINHSVFEKYRATEEQVISRDDKQNCLRILIQDSPVYCELMEKIEKYLEKQYDNVTKEEENLKRFLKIYAKHKGLDRLETILQTNTAMELSQYVRQWKSDHDDMQHIPDKCFGILKFDFSILRKQMIHVPGESLLSLFTLLPSHLNDKCHEISKKTKKLLDSINIIPNDSAFVDFTKAVKNAADHLDQIVDDGKEVKQLMILLEDNRRPNLQIHRANIKEVLGIINQLKAKVDEANAKYDHRLSKFKKDIEGTINKIKSNAKELTSKFQAIQIDNAESEVADILSKISSVLPQINEMHNQIEKIETIQSQLTLNETNFEEARKLYVNTQLINELWTCKKEWKELITQTRREHYSKINCEELSIKWEIFTSRTFKLKQQLPHSSVLSKLIEQISGFENLMDLIRSLQSKSINGKSWKQISQYLAYEIDKSQDGDPKNYPFYDHTSPDYTVDWLIENNICFYKEKIKFIVKKSEKEGQLCNVLTILKLYINTLNLEFVSKKREITLLEENQNVFEEIICHLSQLSQILDQDYSDSIKKQAKGLVKHYQYISEVLAAYCDFGKLWSRYEALFDSNKYFSKQLNKESKDFINWEIGWKKITKNIVLENWSKKIVEETTGLHPSRTTMKQINKINAVFDQIKKGVEEFLDKKRSSFWRYFFFSDEKLLDLLIKMDGQQIHETVPFFYEDIREVNIDRQKDLLISVKSKDGQQLKIGKLVTSKILSEPEEILKSCEQMWKKSLVGTIKKVFNDFTLPLEQQITRNLIIQENVTQVVLAVDHIIWVRLAEQTYLCEDPVGTLADWIQVQEGQIREVFEIMKEIKTEIEKKKTIQLLIQSIFFREKTQYFLKNRTDSLKSYEWQRVLKLCDGKKDKYEKIILQQLNSQIFYGGDFMGCKDINFITPETEKIYININQALHKKQIIVLQGDHSRYQTLCDLSFLAAQPLYQFNFGSGICEKVIDKLFCGACINGGWICLNIPQEYEIISVLASHISLLRKSLQENNYAAQFGKYNVQISQTPYFFFNMPSCVKTNDEFFKKIHYWRSITFVKPDIEKIMTIRALCYHQPVQLGSTIAQLVNQCFKMFRNDYYDVFSLSFCDLVFEKCLQLQLKSEKIIAKVGSVIKKLLFPKLKEQDKNLLVHFFSSYEPESQNSLKRVKTLKTIVSSKNMPHSLDDFMVENSQMMNADSISYQYAKTLYDMMSENRCKRVILVGATMMGKSYLLNFLVKAYAFTKGCVVGPEIKRIYHQAYQVGDVFKILSKSLCTGGSENWIVFDGTIDDTYLMYLSEDSEKLILEGLGVLNMRKHTDRFFIETRDLSNISPMITHSHSILHFADTNNNSLIEAIIKKSVEEPLFKTYEEVCKPTNKIEDQKQQIKALQIKWKKINLSEENIGYLIDQVVSCIQKIVSDGKLKVKTVELLYQISELEIAYRCGNMISSIFKMNWETIKESEKNLRKNIDKFVQWVIVWSLMGLVSQEQFPKFEKEITELLKISSMFSEGLNKYVIYPGAGLEIHPLRSVRAQSAMPNIPSSGVPTNLLLSSNLLQESSQLTKNKFYEEIYLDQPHLVRINTDESALFSYLILLNSYTGTSTMLYGQGSTGKKSIVELYGKNNQEKEEVHCMRLKRHNQYYIGKQIIRPFEKYQGLKGGFMKPSDNYKKLHLVIEDVNLTPKQYPSTEYLRMLINQNGIYTDDHDWITFFHYTLTLIPHQFHFHNLDCITFTSLLSKLFFLQTSSNTKEKLLSIYSPITETWGNSTWEPSASEELRLFTSPNGDNIINATIGIYSMVEEYILNHLSSDSQDSTITKMVLKPKIGDISLILANICQKQEPEKITIAEYAQLWAHEVLRVFGDRYLQTSWMEVFRKEIKKELLLKFKENFTVPEHFMFTDLNRQQYERCPNFEEITQEINAILSQLGYKLPFSPLIDELVEEMLKIYRIISMQNGNLFMLSSQYKVSHQLAKIAVFLKEGVIFDLSGKIISPQAHMLPAVINQISTSIFINLSQAQEQTLYQLLCLLNRNHEPFQLPNEVSQKVKAYFLAIANQNRKQNLKQSGIDAVYKNASKGASSDYQESSWITLMKKKIEENIDSLFGEAFTENCHFILVSKPYCQEQKMFLQNYSSILKHMHISYCSINQAITSKIVKTIESEKKNSLSLFDEIKNNCTKICEARKEKDFEYFLLLNRSQENAEFLKEKISEKINKIQSFLEFYDDIQKRKQQGIQNQNKIQGQIQVLVEKQNKFKEKNEEQQSNFEKQIKQIKGRREILEQNCRQIRNTQTIYEGIIKQLPLKSSFEKQLSQNKKYQADLGKDICLVQALLIFQNNPKSKKSYLNKIKEYRTFLLFENQEMNESQVLALFKRILGKQYIEIDRWDELSWFNKIRIFTFCYNFLSIQNSIYDDQFIKVNDKYSILQKALADLDDNNVYNSCKFLKIFNLPEQLDKKDPKYRDKPESQISKKSLFSQIQKELFKYRAGVVMIESDGQYQIKENEIDTLYRTMNEKKKVQKYRIIIKTLENPNLKFFPDLEDIEKEVNRRSLKIQFGQSILTQKRRLIEKIYTNSQKKLKKQDQLIQLCMNDKNYSHPLLEKLEKINQSINEVDQQINKAKQLLEGEQFQVKNSFLISWFMKFIKPQHVCHLRYPSLLCTFDEIKKSLTILNAKQEGKIASMQDVSPDYLSDWIKMVSVNILLENQNIDIQSYIDFSLVPENSPPLMVFEDLPDKFSYFLSELAKSRYQMKTVDCFSHSYSNNSCVGQFQTSGTETEKRLCIFYNFLVKNSLHRNLLMDTINRFKGIERIVYIIFVDNPVVLKQDKELNKKTSILSKQIPMNVRRSTKNLSQSLETSTNNFFAVLKDSKRQLSGFVNNAKSSSLIQSQGQVLEQKFESSEQGQKIINKIIERFNQLFKVLKKDKETQGEYYKNEVQIYQKKQSISESSSLIHKIEEVPIMIQDFCFDKTFEWNQIISLLLDYEGQIEEEIKKIEKKEIKTEKKKQKKFKTLSNIKENQIWQLIKNLPFAFNPVQFDQTSEPFHCWLIEKALKLNSARLFMKNYLLNLMKIIEGLKPNPYYVMGKKKNVFKIPAQNYFDEICQDFEIVRKGLQTYGIIPSHDQNSMSFKMIANSQASPNIMSIMGSAFNARRIKNISEKQLTMLKIKSCKKLKTSYDKIKTTWKICSQTTQIEQPINHGELCLVVSTDVTNGEDLVNKENEVKLAFCPYCPTQPQTQQAQIGKFNNTQKKEGHKKSHNKQQSNIKPCRTSLIPSQNLLDVEIKTSDDHILGVVTMNRKTTSTDISVSISKPILYLA